MKNLYHFKLGFPKGFRSKFGVIKITYTQNAKLLAQNSKYGEINLPNTINTTTSRAIEIEVVNQVVTKIVYRTEYNSELDIVLALNRDCSVKAVSLSKVGDRCVALDKSKYTIPKNKLI